MNEPRLRDVQCLDSRGLHRMAYWEWGDASNPKVLLCVHGLTRQGRDFDALARAMGTEYRVVCPDVVGRGRSDWLADPMGYAIAHYVADMVCLLARLDAQVVDWVGTSMGGLIGLGLASLSQSPLHKLVLNDVGPVIQPQALQRIGSYVGQSEFWETLDQAADASWALSQGFGPHTREEWLALTAPQLKPATDGGRAGFTARCDPGIAVPFRALTPELVAAGEALLWQSYDRLRCRTLVLRGADSDLLAHDTALAMTRRGPHAQLH
jgi:pimeloyl-ACP methyl ester carboxylesterase